MKVYEQTKALWEKKNAELFQEMQENFEETVRFTALQDFVNSIMTEAYDASLRWGSARVINVQDIYKVLKEQVGEIRYQQILREASNDNNK